MSGFWLVFQHIPWIIPAIWFASCWR